MVRQQTLHQAFAVARQAIKAKASKKRTGRQSTLPSPNPNESASDDEDFSDSDVSDTTEAMNEQFMCICDREDCDYEDDPESCECNACWEERVEDDPALDVMRPDYTMHGHQENPFSDSFKSSDRSLFSAYRDRWMSQDLKDIVRQRRLADPFPAGRTLRYFYLKELLEADPNRVFRFLDLPAEMRNHVYGYLLVLSNSPVSQRSHCFPQILSTCKQVHQEAGDILYADNTILTHITSKHSSNNQPWQQWVWINHRRSRSQGNDLHFAQLPHAMDLYPTFLTRIRKLKIVIDIDFRPGPGGWHRTPQGGADFVRSTLLALASVLMDGNRLRTLQVSVTQGIATPAEVLASMLYPLRRLRNVNAEFQGPSSLLTSLREDMVTEMRRKELEFNTLKHCRLVLSKADAYLNLIRGLEPLEHDIGDGPTGSRSRVISDHVDDLKIKMFYGRSLFADWLGEVKVQTRLAKLEDALAKVGSKNVMALAKAYRKADEETTKYQANEDNRWGIGDLARAKSPSPEPAPL